MTQCCTEVTLTTTTTPPTCQLTSWQELNQNVHRRTCALEITRARARLTRPHISSAGMLPYCWELPYLCNYITQARYTENSHSILSCPRGTQQPPTRSFYSHHQFLPPFLLITVSVLSIRLTQVSWKHAHVMGGKKRMWDTRTQLCVGC